MLTIVGAIGIIANVIVMLVIVQFIIGLLFSFNVINARSQLPMQIYSSINLLLDPLLRPIRRIMPDTGAIDFSPLVLIVGIRILMYLLVSLA